MSLKSSILYNLFQTTTDFPIIYVSSLFILFNAPRESVVIKSILSISSNFVFPLNKSSSLICTEAHSEMSELVSFSNLYNPS